MKHSGYCRLRSLSMAPSVLAVLAVAFIANSAQGQNWDGDTPPDSEDWGVVLTFDMHPAGESPLQNWQYPTGWNPWPTWKESILDILERYDAPATFFVSGFASAPHNTSWNWLLNEAVSDTPQHELAWHSRQHDPDAEVWMNNGPGWTADGYIWYNVICDLPNYNAVRHSWWPANLVSFAYPNDAGQTDVDTKLKQYVRHTRGAGPDTSGWSVKTSEVASKFQLQGFWLDNFNLCDTSNQYFSGGALLQNPGCGEEIDIKDRVAPVTQRINDAYNNDQIFVMAAHYFTDSRANVLGVREDTLVAVLDHIKCLREGGQPSGASCINPTGTITNEKVFHRFQDLPHSGSSIGVPNWCE